MLKSFHGFQKKFPCVCLSLLLLSSVLMFFKAQAFGTVDVSSRTVTSARLRISFATSGEINLYDKIGSNWREITPKAYGIGKSSLNNTSFEPWNDGTLSYVSSSLLDDQTLLVSYKQNLTQAGSGYSNWFLTWDVYTRESYESTLETWARVKVDNGTINKINLSFPFLGVALENGSETYYQDTPFSYGTHHRESYPNQMSIPMVELVNKANKTALYVFYFNNTKGRFSYLDAEDNWGISTWTLNNAFLVRLSQSVYFESTHAFFYSDTSLIDGYSLSSSYAKAASWYSRNLQPLLSIPMNLENFRSRDSNIHLDPYAPDALAQILKWKDYISSIGLVDWSAMWSDFIPTNATRILEVTDLAHTYGIPVGITIDTIIPANSQLYVNHHPQWFSNFNRICTGYTATRDYFFNKVAMWAGLGIDWLFINNMQNDDDMCNNAAHVHDCYFMAYNHFTFAELMLQAINSNNTDGLPHFLWNDQGSDNMANLGTLVVPNPNWGTLIDFVSNVTRVLTGVNTTKYTLEPTWDGLSWDFSNSLKHLLSLATKVIPHWTEASTETSLSSVYAANNARNVSVFLKQHENSYQNQPVFIESQYPFFVTRIGNNMQSVIPVNATSIYSGDVHFEDNNVAFCIATVPEGRDFILVNKNLTSAITTTLHDGAFSAPITLAANETRLFWRRDKVAITRVENAYASYASFGGEKLGFIVNGALGAMSITKVFSSDMGRPSRVLVDTKEYAEGEVWSYDPDSKTVTITWAHSGFVAITLDWAKPEDATVMAMNLLPYVIAAIVLVLGAILYARRKRSRKYQVINGNSLRTSKMKTCQHTRSTSMQSLALRTFELVNRTLVHFNRKG